VYGIGEGCKVVWMCCRMCGIAEVSSAWQRVPRWQMPRPNGVLIQVLTWQFELSTRLPWYSYMVKAHYVVEKQTPNQPRAALNFFLLM
jgi:hypothetical protein